MNKERRAGPVAFTRARPSSLTLMYRKPKFLEVLHAIREEMSREADYDMQLFAEMVRAGRSPFYDRRAASHGGDSSRGGRRAGSPSAGDAPPAARRERRVGS